ncbi:CAP-Gly domain-containing linker protein 1 isoform X2 [Prorops nasuta]|uniref:CAP-Gly domain-containing linker protein 1 isoform X2 n=1 Tax=Prorops nasuta TaxID=863751 RepID=UPI0034CD3734
MTERPSGIKPPSKIGTLPPRPTVVPIPSPRTSSMNTSVILTQDTDSFIIGDRVWVGGTKPGAIAYIGETQFAPGDWAGVVLDEQIGKNDGSVAGVRYFQCEPKRGIFSRLTRLTREPLDESISPTESIRCTLSKSVSPSLTTSTTSLASATSNRELRVGERVIVSSSQGSKTGVLRFIGPTHFQTGEWCGVELDDPLGKNDGSVDGKCYFVCKPKHGLFVPVSKVSRSPASKRSICVIHKPSGAALNASLRKANSRESLTSLASATTSVRTSLTAVSGARRPVLRTSSNTPVRKSLQDQLKEKQQEIENLKKERDLDRERATKASIQADQAEQSAVSLKNQYEKIREEMERTTLDAENAFAKLLQEKNDLMAQLKEEKRKYEDLLFRFEEVSVNKDDIQKEEKLQSVINTKYENRIKDLEKLLSDERERIVQLEKDSVKLFETEEELALLKNEVSSINLQENPEFKGLENRYKGLEESKISLTKLLEEKSDLLVKHENHIKELEHKLLEEERSKTAQNAHLAKIEKEAKDTKIILKEKLEFIEGIRTEYKFNMENASQRCQEAEQKNEEITAKLKLIEEQNSTLIKKIQEYQNKSLDARKLIEEKQKMEDEMTALNLSFVNAVSEAERLRRELDLKDREMEDSKDLNSKQFQDLTQQFQAQIQEKTVYIDEIRSEISHKSLMLNNLEKDLAELKSIIAGKDEEIKNLLEKVSELQYALTLSEQTKNNLESEKKGFETNTESLSQKVVRADEKIAQLTAQKEKLELDIANLISTSTNSSEQLTKYNEDLRNKEKELDISREKIFQAQSALASAEAKLSSTGDTLNKTNLLVEQLRQDVESVRSELAIERKNNVEISEKLKYQEEKEKELQNDLQRGKETEENLRQKSDIINELNIQLKKSQDEANTNQEQLTNLKIAWEADKVAFQKKVNYLETTLKESQEELSSLKKINVKLESEQSANRWTIEEFTEKLQLECENRSRLEKQIQDKVLECHVIEERLFNFEKDTESVNICKENENKDLKVSLEKMTANLEELKNKLNKAEESIAIKEEETTSLKEARLKSDIELKDALENLQKKETEINALTEGKSFLDEKITLLETKLKDTEDKLNTKDMAMEKLKMSMKNIDEEKEKYIQNLVEKLNNKDESLLTNLKKQLDLVNLEVAELKEENNRLEKQEFKSRIPQKSDQLIVTNENNKNIYDAAGGDIKQRDENITTLKLEEEYETAKSQIDFLNSVIVDMQKKNEQLLCKIEVLEIGIPANEADDYSRSTIDKRVAAPRMFCDICDQFDLHETEDCPRQSQDFEEVARSKSKKPSVERPYCENCEMFGHDTNNCEDGETF